MRRRSPRPDSLAVDLSCNVYQRLLVAYPKSYREEYGSAMVQLFRDQCRDAWQAARVWGLVWLWLRSLLDLVKTSLLEHISTIKERKGMLDRIGSLMRPRSAPLVVFAAVFVVVFLFVVITTTLITFILPESYCSTARIKIERGLGSASSYDPYFIQTEFEVIQSELILGKVVDALDLRTVWGKKYAGGERLKTMEAINLLKARMDLRPVRNTSLIAIRVYSDRPDEAASLANAIAEVFRDYRQTQQRLLAQGAAQAAEQGIKQQVERVAALQAKAVQLRTELKVPSPEPASDDLLAKYRPYWEAKREADVANRLLDEMSIKNETARLQSALPQTPLVEIVDRAVPGLRPVRPNKPLNIFLGIMGGMFLASVAGAVMAWIATRLGRRPGRTNSTPGAGSPRPVGAGGSS